MTTMMTAKGGAAGSPTTNPPRRQPVTELKLTGTVPPGATVHFFSGYVLGEVQFAFDAF
jgi:hypothetical protein